MDERLPLSLETFPLLTEENPVTTLSPCERQLGVPSTTGRKTLQCLSGSSVREVTGAESDPGDWEPGGHVCHVTSYHGGLRRTRD